MRRMQEKISFCRICAGGCGMRVTVDDDNRIADIRADDDSVLTAGYACFKGLQAATSHQGPNRLIQPLKRKDDGAFVKIPSEQALDEIAERLRRIIDRDGPEAVAVFCGNGAIVSVAAYAMHRSFLKAIGSDQYFS